MGRNADPMRKFAVQLRVRPRDVAVDTAFVRRQAK